MIFRQDPEMQYRFIQECGPVNSPVQPLPGKKVEIILEGEPHLETILETFQDFLVACGFYLAENESLAIIRETEKDSEEEDDSDPNL